MKKIIWLLLLASVCTSVEAQDRTLYEETIHNKPVRGVEHEVYLGDRMLIQQVGEWKECITPRKSYSKEQGGWTGTYKAKEPICKKDYKSKYYLATYPNALSRNGDNKVNDVRWVKKKGAYSLCQCGSRCVFCIKELNEDDVEAGETFIYKQNSFQQTIEYNGRSSDILKFNYSEFTGGFAREAFSREFQVDLSEGNIAAYKGAIIEVIDATNIQIKYKVIRNFSSDL